MQATEPAFDYVLVGGGLQSALIALAVLHRRPGARIAVVEQGPALGGNHTWSCHAGDIPEGAHDWVEPLLSVRWSGYDVAFPDVRRHVDTALFALTSERLDAVVRRALNRPGCEVVLGHRAVDLTDRAVKLENGRILTAGAVIDARGPDRIALGTEAGYQKFFGIEAEYNEPHGLVHPLLMDATVEQIDGFRFLYVLPMSPTTLLVEDTRFADGPELDRAAVRGTALAYAESLDRGSFRVAREEHGVLPMPWVMPATQAPARGAPLAAGYAGGWFNPVTGYSFPVAARLAAFVAAHEPEDLWGPALAAHAAAHRSQLRFGTFMNWLMFRCLAADQRWTALAHFYRRLPDDGVLRFYALETSWADRLRVFSGRPPAGFSFTRMLGGLRTRPALT